MLVSPVTAIERAESRNFRPEVPPEVPGEFHPRNGWNLLYYASEKW